MAGRAHERYKVPCPSERVWTVLRSRKNWTEKAEARVTEPGRRSGNGRVAMEALEQRMLMSTDLGVPTPTQQIWDSNTKQTRQSSIIVDM